MNRSQFKLITTLLQGEHLVPVREERNQVPGISVSPFVVYIEHALDASARWKLRKGVSCVSV